mmetsp:Transcript_21646/g.57469  ORF Transcript_21646/g.57469 Transcript_21646/m.57469 type:complete len:1162 (-) Transcript_21646:201-3686(-)
MGNETSGPTSTSGAETQMRLPNLVLVVDTVLCGRDQNYARERGSQAPIEHEMLTDLFCVVFLDGLEVGRVATYPSQPILLQPREPQSALALRFFRSSASTLETRVPNFGVEGFLANKELAMSRSGGVFAEVCTRMSDFARYGLPFFTSLWLGLPFESGDTSHRSFDLALALRCARRPDVPKVGITLFKPASVIADMSHVDQLLPDFAEGLNMTVSPSDKGPFGCNGPRKDLLLSPQLQVEGLLRSLKHANGTVHSLQTSIFGSTIHKYVRNSFISDSVGSLDRSVSLWNHQESDSAHDDEYVGPVIRPNRESNFLQDSAVRLRQLEAQLEFLKKENESLMVTAREAKAAEEAVRLEYGISASRDRWHQHSRVPVVMDENEDTATNRRQEVSWLSAELQRVRASEDELQQVLDAARKDMSKRAADDQQKLAEMGRRLADAVAQLTTSKEEGLKVKDLRKELDNVRMHLAEKEAQLTRQRTINLVPSGLGQPGEVEEMRKELEKSRATTKQVQSDVASLSQRLKHSEASRDEALDELIAEQDIISKLRQELADSKENAERLQVKFAASPKQLLHQVEGAFEELLAEQGKIEELRGELYRAKQEVERLRLVETRDLSQTVDALGLGQNEVVRIRAELEDARQRNEALQTDLAAARQECGAEQVNSQKQVATLRTALDGALVVVQAHEERKTVLEGQIAHARSEAESQLSLAVVSSKGLEEKLSQLRSEAEASKLLLLQLQSELATSRSSELSLKKELETTQNQMEELLKLDDGLHSKLHNTLGEVQELERKAIGDAEMKQSLEAREQEVSYQRMYLEAVDAADQAARRSKKLQDTVDKLMDDISDIQRSSVEAHSAAQRNRELDIARAVEAEEFVQKLRCELDESRQAADRELLAVTETLEKERQVCMDAVERATQAEAEVKGNMQTLKQEHERVKQDYKALLGETADLQHERRSLQEQLDDALNSMSSLSLSSGLTRRQGTKSGPVPVSKQVSARSPTASPSRSADRKNDSKANPRVRSKMFDSPPPSQRSTITSDGRPEEASTRSPSSPPASNRSNPSASPAHKTLGSSLDGWRHTCSSPNLPAETSQGYSLDHLPSQQKHRKESSSPVRRSGTGPPCSSSASQPKLIGMKGQNTSASTDDLLSSLSQKRKIKGSVPLRKWS